VEFAGIKLRRHTAESGEAAKLLDQIRDSDDSGCGRDFGNAHGHFYSESVER
jgi:hypothetical protein